MGLRVNTNLEALQVLNNIGATNNEVSKSLKRLSSGLRISAARDDASGFAIANSFAAKISAMKVASQNAAEAQSMLQTADGAYSRINDILVRMKSLATEAASGQTESLTTMNNEFAHLQAEIDRIANSTRYGDICLLNAGASAPSGPSDFSAQMAQYTSDVSQLWDIALGPPCAGMWEANSLLSMMSVPPIKMGLFIWTAYDIHEGLSSYRSSSPPSDSNVANLLDDMINLSNLVYQGSGSAGAGVTFQVGATNTSSDRLYISFRGAGTASLGVSSTAVGIASLASAQAAMSALDVALTSINAYMGNVGAFQNRIQYTIDNLGTSIRNYASSESTIRDADMASEISDLTKRQILQQAGMSMLSQANSQPQAILLLLE